ncbi:extracellular solute-binding protein [Salisediminibacterium halotolerans]|uniref:extracellular solute-binding protein n=1 Tax=Salisediminibacterium halotolerans TaxID=517425 RepID=UPI000F10EC80|nr:extracellular solute-binding protein [Salisediminibacterium halotolerans]RLJ75627.1 iron(III) transport system substrate-binding protein [Actinophytocola xinjiangensis]RPE89481.1 iron(III) transport system substrate-binding protein [Salisediminibacterium halotolerans]TWG36240.1 iron(III) transport system substrate-binding protein [Salisediminibacterium halotolerans]GEL08274.1 putative 2-aminoethylphosphonate ABC transporter substrate-binding protein [Salisediminibacterium halotolerans]
MKKSILSLTAVSAAAVLTACGGENETVTMYTHNDEDEMQAFASGVEEATGVETEVLRMSSEEAWSRIDAEHPDVNADMMWGMLHSFALVAENEEDMLASYDSPEWEDVPDEFVDPEGRWYGWSYWFNALAVNEELLEENDMDVPESWDDLLDPQYEGEIALPDPGTSGTAFLFVSTLMQEMGEEEAWEYLDELDDNVGQYSQSGSAPAQMAAQGEYAIGITWDQAIFDRIDEGYPIDIVIPEEGVGYDLDVAWIFEGAENQEAAETVIDYIGSDAGMELAAEHRSMVTKPDVDGTIDFEPNLIDYDAVWASENRERIMDEWQERFD